jgi:hypothetical protein
MLREFGSQRVKYSKSRAASSPRKKLHFSFTEVTVKPKNITCGFLSKLWTCKTFPFFMKHSLHCAQVNSRGTTGPILRLVRGSFTTAKIIPLAGALPA